MKRFSKRIRVSLVLAVFCLVGLSVEKEVRAGDFEIEIQGKGIILRTDGQVFKVGTGLSKEQSWRWNYSWLSTEGYLISTDSIEGTKCRASSIKELEVVLDEEDEKVIYFKGGLYSRAEKRDIEHFYLETNLRIKKGIPCLFVHQRLVNPTDAPRRLRLVSHSSDAHKYVLPAEEIRISELPKDNKWHTYGHGSWIWLLGNNREKGLGVIPLPPLTKHSSGFGGYGRSRATSWGSVGGIVEEEDYLEATSVFALTKTPQEIKVLYEKIKGMALNRFLTPQEKKSTIAKSVKSVTNPAKNCLIVDLVKLAPYAQWRSYYGKIKFNHAQEKVECALYGEDALDKETRKKYGQTILMNFLYPDGYVRGKFPLFLPQAEKTIFKARTTGSDCSVGYYKKGKGIKYLIERRKGELEHDLSFLSYGEINLLLKAERGGEGGSFVHWVKPRVILFYPEEGKSDLAISPSDIDLVPYPDGKISIQAVVHNIANANANRFEMALYDGENLLGEREVLSLSSKDSLQIKWEPREFKRGEHRFKLKINSKEEENTKVNNEAVLICKLPIYGIMIKNIEGYPYPWRAEEVKVNLDNKLLMTDEYHLRCSVFDYWGREFRSFIEEIPAGKNILTIKPLPEKKLGWWKLEIALLYKGNEIDKVSDTFCYAPEPNPQKDAIFGVKAGTYRINLKSIGRKDFPAWVRFTRSPDYQLEMLKYTGATYIGGGWPYFLCLDRPERQQSSERFTSMLVDALSRQGQFYLPHFGYGVSIPSNEKEFVSFLSSMENRAYEVARKYRGKIPWWQVLGECNFIPPSRYTRILKAFYKGAKRGDPGCKIKTQGLGGGPGGMGLLDSGKRGTKYEWQAEMYEQARGYFDAIANHPYARHLPEEEWHKKEVKPCIDLIEKHGDLGKIEYHNTEWAPAADTGTGSLAAHIVRAYLYQLGQKRRGFSLMVFYVAWIQNTPITWTRQALCKYNMHPQPQYQAYAVAAKRLTGARFIEKKDVGEGRYCFIFKKDRKKFAYLWKREGNKEIFVLPAKREVKVMNLMGQVKEMVIKDEKVELIISLDPICVEGLDLRKFRVISRRDCTKEIGFEDEYPEAKRLKESNINSATVFYNMAKIKWVKGESGVKQILDRGFKGIESKPLPKEATAIAKHTEEMVTLDGDLSEWEDYPSHRITKSSAGKISLGGRASVYTGNADLSWTFYTAWDDLNLYIAFDVTDNVVINRYLGATMNAYGGDCIEVLIDGTRLRQQIAGTEFFKYYFGLNGEICRISAVGKKNDAKMAWKKKDNGYTMEVAIPLREILLEGVRDGYRIAFDTAINDFDEQDILKCYMSWHKTMGMHDAVSIGDLIFTE